MIESMATNLAVRVATRRSHSLSRCRLNRLSSKSSRDSQASRLLRSDLLRLQRAIESFLRAGRQLVLHLLGRQRRLGTVGRILDSTARSDGDRLVCAPPRARFGSATASKPSTKRQEGRDGLGDTLGHRSVGLYGLSGRFGRGAWRLRLAHK